mmetsp:Transcript_40120/g.93179  ORF Transcript_40120/g.93179 Transcript_40120/m.93179 type:complete len:200 (+) Transcript_40120:1778-2377(+)
MEGAHFRLQLGSLVCCCDPAVAANLVIAVKTNDVAVALPQIVARCLDSVVPRPKNAYVVWPHLRLRCEARDTLDYYPAPDLFIIQLLPVTRTLLYHEGDVLRLTHAGGCQRLLHIKDFGADLHRESHGFLGTGNCQRCFCEGSAVSGANSRGINNRLPGRVKHVQPHLAHLYHSLLCPASRIPELQCWRDHPLFRTHRY